MEQQDDLRSTQSYYDRFSPSYERERHHGYHRLIDELELELVRRYGTGCDILEAGCGTGLLLAEAARAGRSAIGLDLSRGMLGQARDRGLRVVQGSLTTLPLPDASVDLVYSMKVLAHVPPIREAIAELARVTRPGGVEHLDWELRGPDTSIYTRDPANYCTDLHETTSGPADDFIATVCERAGAIEAAAVVAGESPAVVAARVTGVLVSGAVRASVLARGHDVSPSAINRATLSWYQVSELRRRELLEANRTGDFGQLSA